MGLPRLLDADGSLSRLPGRKLVRHKLLVKGAVSQVSPQRLADFRLTSAIRVITPTQQDRLAVKGGVAWLFRQGLNLTPRRLGVVEVVSRSRVASLANPDASGRVLAGGGGASVGAKASKDAAEQEHQSAKGRTHALAFDARGRVGGRTLRFNSYRTWR